MVFSFLNAAFLLLSVFCCLIIGSFPLCKRGVSSDVWFSLILLRLARGLTKTVIETSVQALMEVVNKIMGRPFKD